MTQEEAELASQLTASVKALDKLQKQGKKGSDEWDEAITAKNAKQQELDDLIRSHTGPRRVNIASVVDKARLKRRNEDLPLGITWHNVKHSRRIAEFSSDESRAIGLRDLDVTFDKIVLKWKSLDILRQVVLNDFIMPVLNRDGSVTEKQFFVMTASAGQLRTDKVQCLSVEAWNKISDHLLCGLTADIINSKGGINVNKYMAYLALPCSATDPWPGMPIDRCIVVPDFIAPVTAMMETINSDYSHERGIRTVDINHGDGVGMMLPSVSKNCFMVRGPWLKGLLGPFDYLQFCDEHNVPAVLTDVWGLEHDLRKENIQIIFTESQLKLWSYYDSWDQYKSCFKSCGCVLCRTNYEENYIPDCEINYQMLSTLIDMTDDEIRAFTESTYERVNCISKDKEHMLATLGADPASEQYDKKALALYPSLLGEKYFIENLRAIKRKWLFDARSGRIRCANKRLFVLPDMYAMCEFYFLGIKEPEGLLKSDEVGARLFRNKIKVDCLRSPHLYMEHAPRKVSHDPEVYRWFVSNAIYTSVKDMISRILQFDCDGDQLNVVSDETIVSVAERDIAKYDIVPLFYDANKAPKSMVTREEMFNGLKRAHDYSGIGAVSNALTRLWNRKDPDIRAAADLCYYNNQVIDAAKTGEINDYAFYPAVAKRINQATGGNTGRMPWFFTFTRNGRHVPGAGGRKRKVCKPTSSTMNRICKSFSTVGKISTRNIDIPPFNYRMLMDGSDERAYNEKIPELFVQLCSEGIQAIIENRGISNDIDRFESLNLFSVEQEIVTEMVETFGSLEECYPSITEYFFNGPLKDKVNCKQFYWRIFGEIAVGTLEKNLETATICEKCGTMLPQYNKEHTCINNTARYFVCIDCGKSVIRKSNRQQRCEICTAARRKEM